MQSMTKTIDDKRGGGVISQSLLVTIFFFCFIVGGRGGGGPSLFVYVFHVVYQPLGKKGRRASYICFVFPPDATVCLTASSTPGTQSPRTHRVGRERGERTTSN